ncbi:hypothetical protein LMG28614_00667 [Paraburkholderia ultramafica]|uniref:Porin n=1 Tax=Paraburkholderia ultramafica TaxID=1544867 RepID=A0A6S7B5E3_9BURK|nr:hypothetical protein [Paraburkholderia ultramafica]CAB3778611.1 hypothetical protein LMG28614_00667 [Paraburkholderia ultramafica]
MLDGTSNGRLCREYGSRLLRSGRCKSTDQQRIIGAGASYDFGIVNVLASYTNVLFNYPDSSGLRLQNGEPGGYKRFTPAWLVGVSYVYTAGDYSVFDEITPDYRNRETAC